MAYAVIRTDLMSGTKQPAGAPLLGRWQWAGRPGCAGCLSGDAALPAHLLPAGCVPRLQGL